MHVVCCKSSWLMRSHSIHRNWDVVHNWLHFLFNMALNTGVYLIICYQCVYQLEDHEPMLKNFQQDGAMSEQENIRRYWYGYTSRNFLKMFEQNHVGRLTGLLQSCGKLRTRIVGRSTENVMECFTVSVESSNGMMKDRVIRLSVIYILLLVH